MVLRVGPSKHSTLVPVESSEALNLDFGFGKLEFEKPAAALRKLLRAVKIRLAV